jgi:hypothetical protein
MPLGTSDDGTAQAPTARPGHAVGITTLVFHSKPCNAAERPRGQARTNLH